MVDFPDITVVIGHTGFMLAEEVIFFMGKFANVWGDFAYWAEASRSGRWRRSGASRRRWGHEPLHLGHLIRTSRSATVWISSRRLRRTRKSTSSNPSSPRKTRPDFSATTPRGCLASGNRWESRVDPIQAVRDEIADLSRGDLEAVLSYYTDDVYFEDTSVPTPCRTKAEMRDFMKVFYDAFPDLRIEIRNVFESPPSPSTGGTDSSPSPSGGGKGGGYVTAEYDLLGTMRGAFLGNPPTGKAFRIKAVSIYEHNGTLFTKETVYYDSAALFAQIGIDAS